MQTSSSFIAFSLLCSLKERHKHRMELGLVGCLLTKMPAPTHGFYRSNSAIDCFCIAKVWKAFRLVCGHHKSRPLFFLKQGCAFSRFSGLPVLGRSTMIVTGVIAIRPTTGRQHCKRYRSNRHGYFIPCCRLGAFQCVASGFPACHRCASTPVFTCQGTDERRL